MSAFKHNQAFELDQGGEPREALALEQELADQIVAHEGVDSVPPAIAQRLGFLHVRLEESESGMEWIERGIRTAAAQSNVPAQIGALLAHARASLILRHVDRATLDVTEAERLDAASGGANPLSAQTARLIRAQILLARGDAPAARAATQRLLSEVGFPRDQSNVRLPTLLTFLARVQLALNLPAESLESARAALTVAEKDALDKNLSADVGAALMAVANAQRAGHEEAAARATAARAATLLMRRLGAMHSETRAAAGFAAALPTSSRP